MTDKTCATCASWNPRESGGMAKHRMAICARGPKWRFFPPQSSCPKHEAAPAAVIAKRAAWLADKPAPVLTLEDGK